MRFCDRSGMKGLMTDQNMVLHRAKGRAQRMCRRAMSHTRSMGTRMMSKSELRSYKIDGALMTATKPRHSLLSRARTHTKHDVPARVCGPP